MINCVKSNNKTIIIMKKIYMFLSCCLVFAAMTFLSTGRLFAQCDPIEITQTDIFFEDFSSFQAIDSLNGEGVMPTCWNKIYNGATAGYDPKVYNGSSAVVSGDNCIAITSGRSAFLGFLEQYNAGEANYVIFPFITNGFNELQLMFTSKMSSTADGTLEIGYITDITDDSTFVALTTVSSTTAATSQSILISSLLREPLRQDAVGETAALPMPPPATLTMSPFARQVPVGILPTSPFPIFPIFPL